MIKDFFELKSMKAYREDSIHHKVWKNFWNK